MVPVVLATCAILTKAASEKSIERVSARLLNTGHEAREWILAKLYLLSGERSRTWRRKKSTTISVDLIVELGRGTPRTSM